MTAEHAGESDDHVVYSPDAKDDMKELHLPEKYWAGELRGMLSELNPRGCQRVRFALVHPNERVFMQVEVVEELFVVQRVLRGVPKQR